MFGRFVRDEKTDKLKAESLVQTEIQGCAEKGAQSLVPVLALKVIELPAECTPKHDFVSSEGLLGLPSAPSPALKTVRHLKP